MKHNNTLKPTPLIELKFNDKTIWGKAEYLNPSGSVKDRPIKNILDRAEQAGLLKKGDTIIEATSGNAGISFAMMAAERGMQCVIVMPSNMSQERKKMLRTYFVAVITLLWLCFSPCCKAQEFKPNILVILCDDLGIGDVSCFNNQGKIVTPNIDALAKGGMKFTDAHTSSSVCTPTRYALLTGRYNWRSRLQNLITGIDSLLPWCHLQSASSRWQRF